MAKAEKFHTEAIEEIYDLLRDMINANHVRFRNTEFLILMKHGGWKSKGKTVFGKFKVLGDDLRSTWDKDAILYLNADMWNKMSHPQHLYVLDHALFGLDVKSDKNGNVLEDADGRPLLKTVPPDIEAFVEVIKRHGTTTEDVKRLALAIKEVNPDQMTIEEATAAADGENHAEPREGVRGKINPDSTVDVEDENQMTLDEALEDADSDPMNGVDDVDPDELPF